jgi:hypothetical protein
MRLAIIATTLAVMLASATVSVAMGTIGLYFTQNHGQMHYSPMPYEEFNGYVYCHAVACDLSAVEFRVALPPGIELVALILPQGGLNMGDPKSGVSVAYWPPFSPGYSLLCTLDLFAMKWCASFGGTMIDAPVRVGPHPETGLVSYSCRTVNLGQSEYYLRDFIPLTSVLCPVSVATQEKSWGAIKSLFQP